MDVQPLSPNQNPDENSIQLRSNNPDTGRETNTETSAETSTEASAEASAERNRQTGNVLSSISLVAGTTIGAGILALPAATLPAGLLPSSLLMVATWLYMVVSGLLIAEANLHTQKQLGRSDLGLLGTIQHQLGKGGAIAAGIIYIFIHYALLVAYTARGGDILAATLENLGRFLGLTQSVPLWWGHVIFSLLFASLLFWSSEKFVGRLNSTLLAIVILAFGGLLTLTLRQVESSQLWVQHWDLVSSAIPVMFVAFVYQNVVPVITTQLKGDRPKIRQSIVLGSVIPLVMFLLWNAVILGSIDWHDLSLMGDMVFDPIESLRMGNAHPQLGVVISIFSEFAIATSFIGFIYGLLSIFGDLLAAVTHTSSTHATTQRTLIYVLMFAPPLGLSCLSPTIFFDAIDISGALGTSLLYGITPAAMVWKLRDQETAIPSAPWVAGGKATLLGVIGIAIAVIVQYISIKIH